MGETQGPMTAGALIEALQKVPNDAIVIGLLNDPDADFAVTGYVHERGFMVMGTEQYLNDAGRVIAHLALFDYEAAEDRN